MPLTTGSRLGPYEILSAAGGGIAEVYHARDAKLDREVVIILPEPSKRVHDIRRRTRSWSPELACARPTCSLVEDAQQ